MEINQENEVLRKNSKIEEVVKSIIAAIQKSDAKSVLWFSILACLLVICVSIAKGKGMESKSVIVAEEVLEGLIEMETGVDIDDELLEEVIDDIKSAVHKGEASATKGSIDPIKSGI